MGVGAEGRVDSGTGDDGGDSRGFSLYARFGKKDEEKKNEMNFPNDKSERPDGFLTA